MANKDFNLQIEITTMIDGAVKGFESLIDVLKASTDVAESLSKSLDEVAKSLDDVEKRFKKFGRELTTNVTAPIAALAGLSLKHIYDEALAGRGTAAMNSFGASVQALMKDFKALLADIGQQLVPTFNKIINVTRALIQTYRDLSPETKSFITNFALIAAALGPLSLAFSSFLSVAVQITKGLSELIAFGPKLVALFANPYTYVVALAAAVAGLINLMHNLSKAGMTVGESIVKSLDLAASYMEKTFYPLLSRILKKVDQNIKDTFGHGIVVGILGDKADQKTALGQFADSIGEIGQVAKENFENLQKELNDRLATIGSSIGDSFTFGLMGLIEKFKKSLSEVKTPQIVTNLDLERLREIQRIAEQIKNSFAGGLADAFVDFASGAKTAQEAFNNFAMSFLRQITQMILQAQILRALGQTSWFGSAATSIAGSSYVGAQAPINLASGGYVSGAGTGTSDSIPAWLSNGEFVMTAKAVSRFGTGFFDRINAISSGPSRSSYKENSFADGGLVSSSSQAPQVVIENSGSEKTVARTEFDPISAVTTVFLEDMNKNGPISKSIQSSYGIKRGGFR